MSAQQKLLQLLADGELHSGSELARELGISRTAIWKQIGQLEALELEVLAQAGQGYRLAAPLELLDADEIRSSMSAATRALGGAPELFWSLESTSDYLLEQDAPVPGSARACLTEYQSSGRGRRGRQWFAPAGHGICLSVAWTFPVTPASFSCLGLAVGVGVLRALRAAGVEDAALKWPNDVVIGGNKLAGILIDVRGEAGGPLHVVAGVGVNYRLNQQSMEAVEASGGVVPAAVQAEGAATESRNRIAARLIDELCHVLQQFAAEGFAPLVAEWEAADYLRGKTVNVSGDSGRVAGTARGITPDGRLRLDANGSETLLMTGDVTVRAKDRAN